MQKRKCIICGKPLNDGIMINGRGICRSCEERLIYSQSGTDFYEYYINCIKKTIPSNIKRRVNYKWGNYLL